MEPLACIQLGGNQPQTPYWFGRALAAACTWSGTGYCLASPWYRSPPWGYQSANDFLNRILVFPYSSKPESLLRNMQRLEQLSGKPDQSQGYADRKLDLDLLFLGEEIVNKKDLTLPHPRLHLRNFVLFPLVDILPDFVHPLLQKQLHELKELSPDMSTVERWMD